MASRMYSHNNHGFTLIEMLLVLALLTIIVGLSALLLFQTKFVAMREARAEIKSLLAVARSEAMYGREGRMIGVLIDMGTIKLVSALPAATTTSLLVLETNTNLLTHITTDPNMVEVWFYPYSGRVSSPGEISLFDGWSQASTSITMNYEGIIE